MKKCLDTYALIEIKLGNPKFDRYLDIDFVITDITLAEFYSVLLREEDEKTADYLYKKFSSRSAPVDKIILKESVKFRHENKKTGLSFFDAVGYIFSIRNECLFVTGDKEFEDMENVEFVKK